MAIVMEYTTPRGTKIEFCDDAYAGCTPEELRRREEEIRRTAWRCWAKLHEIRRDAAGEGSSDDAQGVNAVP